MGQAIKAVLDMQGDCIRLFRDLDKALELDSLRAISGNNITTGLGGNSITSPPGSFLARYFYRFYSLASLKHSFLGVNICFHDHGREGESSPEPLFIAANIQYDPEQAEESFATKSWDPWIAFLDKNPEGIYGTAIAISPWRSNIKRIAVTASPLFSIRSIDDAIRVINVVGRPGQKRW